ncbi:MAG TPA: VOC family protein [Polyangiaceae bacterium]|nr:VOC family protein [Polyangiaceae bacterium]
MKTIRQAVVAARELAPVEQQLCQVFGLDVAYRDPAVGFFGLINAVLPVGSTFLEVVSPVRPDVTAARFLERRGGDAGYMLLVQTDDLAGDRRRLAGMGVREVWSTELDDIAAVHLHPSDIGGAILSIDQPKPPEGWRWGGPSWRDAVHTDVVDRVVGVELAARDPKALAARWAEVLDVESTLLTGDIWQLSLDQSRITVAPLNQGEHPGLRAIELGARDPERALAAARRMGLLLESSADTRAVIIAGTRFRLR